GDARIAAIAEWVERTEPYRPREALNRSFVLARELGQPARGDPRPRVVTVERQCPLDVRLGLFEAAATHRKNQPSSRKSERVVLAHSERQLGARQAARPRFGRVAPPQCNTVCRTPNDQAIGRREARVDADGAI